MISQNVLELVQAYGYPEIVQGVLHVPLTAGGVHGAEGAVWVLVRGAAQKIHAAEQLIHSVGREPACHRAAVQRPPAPRSARQAAPQAARRSARPSKAPSAARTQKR